MRGTLPEECPAREEVFGNYWLSACCYKIRTKRQLSNSDADYVHGILRLAQKTDWIANLRKRRRPLAPVPQWQYGCGTQVKAEKHAGQTSLAPRMVTGPTTHQGHRLQRRRTRPHLPPLPHLYIVYGPFLFALPDWQQLGVARGKSEAVHKIQALFGEAVSNNVFDVCFAKIAKICGVDHRSAAWAHAPRLEPATRDSFLYLLRANMQRQGKRVLSESILAHVRICAQPIEHVPNGTLRAPHQFGNLVHGMPIEKFQQSLLFSGQSTWQSTLSGAALIGCPCSSQISSMPASGFLILRRVL